MCGNHGCRTFAVTDDSLVVGTANPFYGPQVWTLAESKSDVDYDINSDGKVDVNDATYIQHVVARMRNCTWRFHADKALVLAGQQTHDRRLDYRY